MNGLRSKLIILKKFLNVLPVLEFGVVTCCWLMSGNAIAADVVPEDRESITLRSSISSHAETLWSGLDSTYTNRTVLKRPLNLTVLPEQQVYADADLVEIPLHDAISACDEGRLNLLPLHRMLYGNASYFRSIVPNGIQPCSVGHSLWATVVVFDQEAIRDDSPPALIQDFFNTQAYPGRRAIKKSPRAFVEWVLLNNGYPSNQLYSVMALEQAWIAVESALTDLSAEIVWVDSDLQALELLDSGEVAFAAVSSENVVRKMASSSQVKPDEYGVIWDGAIAHMTMLAIPKNSSANDAMELLRYVTDPTRNVQMSSAYGYAPVHAAQADLIEDRFHHALPMGAQLNNLVWGNSKWWREEGEELEEMFLDFVNRPTITDTASLDVDPIGS